MLDYQTPSEIIASVVHAPSTPSFFIGPRKIWAMRCVTSPLPSIMDLAVPELRLAGLRINPRTGEQSRASHWNDVCLFHVRSGDTVAVTGLPDNLRVRRTAWAPDGRHIALAISERDGLALWLVEVPQGRARRLTPPRLLEIAGAPFSWLPDSQGLIARFIPARRGSTPSPPAAPAGPIVQESYGQRRPARTYQDLLKNAHDEAVFDHYITSRLTHVSLTGRTRGFGPTGLIVRASVSPSGKYILVDQLQRPYSYQVGFARFPRTTVVLDRKGTLVHRVANLPLAEDIPVAHGSVRQGPRSVQWRPDAPATLAWVEALDGGDGSIDVAHRDRVYLHSAPFSDPPSAWIDLELRFGGCYWGGDDLALLVSSWYRTRRLKVLRAAPGDAESTMVWDRNFEDRYNDPGAPLTTRNDAGRHVLRRVGDDRQSLLLAGVGASERGNEPFLDRFDLQAGTTERLWQSKPPRYEQILHVMDPQARQLLLMRESVEAPPNVFLWTRGSPSPFYQLTDHCDPTPEHRNTRKEIVRYERGDGMPLTGTIYLPADGEGPWPTLLWAYPREIKTADAAGQVRDSPHRFLRVTHWSPHIWCALGYAVLSDPSMPIYAEGDEQPNDTYIAQLVAGARAAVDFLVDRGISQPGQIAVGGHSYGAFMTLNLLAHSDLFSTGIARSGAYNRTLTPFGFQAEERTLWDAASVYTTMSPLLHADKVTAPVLLIHGDADNNSGTWKMQSERMYGALKGLGKDVRFVLLPHESHAYRAAESVKHMLWETQEWLRKYLS